MCQGKVLIIEDDAGAVEAFAPMLTQHGYEVLVAVDAAMGLQVIQQSSPDAILLDLHLPDIDGVAFLRRLRTSAARDEIPAAVITGDYLVDDQVVVELKVLGARLFFKPLWEEDLVQIVGALIDSRSRSRSSAQPTS